MVFFEGKCSVCGTKLYWNISEVNGRMYVVRNFKYCPACLAKVCDNPACMDAHLRYAHNIGGDG